MIEALQLYLWCSISIIFYLFFIIEQTPNDVILDLLKDTGCRDMLDVYLVTILGSFFWIVLFFIYILEEVNNENINR